MSGSASPMESVQKPKFLVVDCDRVHLRHLRQSFIYLDCDATFCSTEDAALLELTDPEQRYDIVLADVGRENGFKFIDFVCSWMKIPIIMMSSENNGKLFAGWRNRGASECVAKPLQNSDLQRFRQAALVQRGGHLQGSASNSASGSVGDSASGSVSDSASGSERLDGRNKAKGGKIKRLRFKSRFVWTEEYRALFVMAVDSLGGIHKAVPSKILRLMDVHGVTRAQIASHLQKYRLSLDPNKCVGTAKGMSSDAMTMSDSMQVPWFEDRAAVGAHGSQQDLSFGSPEYNPYAQNTVEQLMISETEGHPRYNGGMVPDFLPAYEIDGHGYQHLPPMEAPRLQGIPDIQVPSYVHPVEMPDGITAQEWDAFVSFDPDLPGLMELPTFGPPNGPQADYPLGQPEMGNCVLPAQMDMSGNYPVNHSLIPGNVEVNSFAAMRHPQQQERSGRTEEDQQWQCFGPSQFGQGPENGHHGF